MLNKYRLIPVTLCVIGCTFASSPFVKAGETTKPAKSVVEEVKKSCITGSLGVALTNEYIYTGLVQDKDTLIAQPYLNLYFKLYEGEGYLNSITFNLPLWWSIHDINKPRVPAGTKNKDWYEFDVSPGFTFNFAKKWSLTISDYIFTSPGNYFDTSHNLSVAFNYDDSDLLGAFALRPHIYFIQELDNHSGLGLDGSTLSQYYEIGIAPGLTFEKDSTYPITMTFPVTVGLGSSGYYGQGFGFFSIGATASVPLAFIPSCYGSWSTSLSGLYYYLGSNASQTDNPDEEGDGRRSQGVISWSIGTSF